MIADLSLLHAALIGYEAERERIEKAIAEIRAKLGGRAMNGSGPVAKRVRPPLSAAARKRIAAAQKKRWAAFRKAKSQR